MGDKETSDFDGFKNQFYNCVVVSNDSKILDLIINKSKAICTTNSNEALLNLGNQIRPTKKHYSFINILLEVLCLILIIGILLNYCKYKKDGSLGFFINNNSRDNDNISMTSLQA